MKKKFLAVLACMLAVPMVMGGCSGDSANSSAPASSDEASSSAEASSSSGETVKITAWLNAPLENEMAYYEAFSEKYPQYEIEYTLYQDDELNHNRYPGGYGSHNSPSQGRLSAERLNCGRGMRGFEFLFGAVWLERHELRGHL